MDRQRKRLVAMSTSVQKYKMKLKKKIKRMRNYSKRVGAQIHLPQIYNLKWKDV